MTVLSLEMLLHQLPVMQIPESRRIWSCTLLGYPICLSPNGAGFSRSCGKLMLGSASCQARSLSRHRHPEGPAKAEGELEARYRQQMPTGAEPHLLRVASPKLTCQCSSAMLGISKSMRP
jgi:hypothetical protein